MPYALSEMDEILHFTKLDKNLRGCPMPYALSEMEKKNITDVMIIHSDINKSLYIYVYITIHNYKYM